MSPRALRIISTVQQDAGSCVSLAIATGQSSRPDEHRNRYIVKRYFPARHGGVDGACRAVWTGERA